MGQDTCGDVIYGCSLVCVRRPLLQSDVGVVGEGAVVTEAASALPDEDFQG